MSNRLKWSLGVVGLAAAVWGYQFFGTATIAITSEPEGAVVRVDGRQRGITPISRLELDSGSHFLEIAHSHYASYTESVSLRRGDHLTRAVTLRAGEGVFEFLSNPRGAWVEIDGVRQDGVTPMTATVASGPHEIAMGREERHIVKETHTVRDGQTEEVNFNLNIDPHGSVTITTSPRNAKIEFIGEDIAYTPKVRVQIGEYPVRISKSGYRTQELRLQVRYGENLRHIDLEREYGNLVVDANPAGAEVLVTYADGGRTRREKYARNMRIPVGRIEVRARALGHRTGFRTLNLAAQGARVRFSLERMTVETGVELVDRRRDGGMAPAMVVVPAGEFVMGDNDGPPSEQPERTVALTQPFAVAKYELSIGEYADFSAATGRAMPDKVDAQKRDHAMAYVSFEDATAYAQWLSVQTGERYRLLTEAEWEYVARAGSRSDYFFGDDVMQLCAFANIADMTTRKTYREWDVLRCDDGLLRPGPVGSYQPNPFGVYDIYGNVSEWVLDCGMPEYSRSPTDGSAAVEGSGCGTHGFRGGSWDSTADEARSAYRNTARDANDDRGIRLMREL